MRNEGAAALVNTKRTAVDADVQCLEQRDRVDRIGSTEGKPSGFEFIDSTRASHSRLRDDSNSTLIDVSSTYLKGLRESNGGTRASAWN